MIRVPHMLSSLRTSPVPTLARRKSTLCLLLLSHMVTLRVDTTKRTVLIPPRSLAMLRDPSGPTLPQPDLSLSLRSILLPHTLRDRRLYTGSRRFTVP